MPRVNWKNLKAVKESTTENKFVVEAKKLGCKTRKLNGMGARDWPDRLVLIPGGVKILIEFKREGHELRPSQEDFQEDAGKIGHMVYVFEAWEPAIALVKSLMK